MDLWNLNNKIFSNTGKSIKFTMDVKGAFEMSKKILVSYIY